jgi:hypothetical protein
MNDSTFVYWTSDGERHEVPIICFQVPAGASLGPVHSCLHDRNEDISDLKSCGIAQDQALLPAMALRQTG